MFWSFCCQCIRQVCIIGKTYVVVDVVVVLVVVVDVIVVLVVVVDVLVVVVVGKVVVDVRVVVEVVVGARTHWNLGHTSPEQGGATFEQT